MFFCLFVIFVRFPVSYILSKYTGLDIRFVYIVGHLLEVCKSFAGFILVKKDIWLKTIV